MSNISNVASTTNTYPTANQSSGVSQLIQNFKAIGTALESGDLSTAQTALSSFQKALQGVSQGNSQTSSSQPFGKNSQANSDYQNLTNALQSGDLASAQKAYASLQTDLKSSQSTQAAHKGHRHHHASAPTSTSTTSSASGATVGAANSSSDNEDSLLNVTA